MKWNETNYPRIGETVLRTTLPNGLTVAVVPKPLYRKRYAFFTTRYGGMDMRFRLDGVWHNTLASRTIWSTRCSTPRTATLCRF